MYSSYRNCQHNYRAPLPSPVNTDFVSTVRDFFQTTVYFLPIIRVYSL